MGRERGTPQRLSAVVARLFVEESARLCQASSGRLFGRVAGFLSLVCLTASRRKFTVDRVPSPVLSSHSAVDASPAVPLPGLWRTDPASVRPGAAGALERHATLSMWLGGLNDDASARKLAD